GVAAAGLATDAAGTAAGIAAACGAAARAEAASGEALRAEEAGENAGIEGAASEAPIEPEMTEAVTGETRSTTCAQAEGPGTVAAKAAKVRRARRTARGDLRCRVM